MAMTFLQYCLFDTNWKQRKDIDHEVEVEANDFSSVQQQIAGLKSQIRELSITIGVLVRMLAEGVPVEADTLKYRVEAAVDALSPAATGRLTCARCGALRLPATTMMTSDGPVCDPGCAVTR